MGSLSEGNSIDYEAQFGHFSRILLEFLSDENLFTRYTMLARNVFFFEDSSPSCTSESPKFLRVFSKQSNKEMSKFKNELTSEPVAQWLIRLLFLVSTTRELLCVSIQTLPAHYTRWQSITKPLHGEDSEIGFFRLRRLQNCLLEAQKCVTDIWPAFYHYNDILLECEHSRPSARRLHNESVANLPSGYQFHSSQQRPTTRISDKLFIVGRPAFAFYEYCYTIDVE